MKNAKGIIASILALVMIASLFSGCSSKSEIMDFIYPFSGNIVSFDPQISSTSDEFLIIENCFEGLVRVNDDGSVQPATAESWDISDDGLTYTFNLRKGAKWHIEEESKVQELMGNDFNPDITANDFVFALRRAADKATQSPLYSSISNIVNASKIHSGEMSTSKLGVKAVDTYTLEIKLKSPDSGFLNTLSTAVAMPCNEEFFNATGGRYGLGLDYTIFNGQFYVSSILEASYILKRNDQYTGKTIPKVTDITLNIVDENSEISKRLKSGYYDCAYITGREYEELEQEDITAIPYSNKMWAFVFNKNNLLLNEKKIRQALCMSLSDIDLSASSYLSKADGFVPPSCLIGDDSATDKIGKTVVARDSEKAIELWKEGLSAIGASTAEIKVIVTEDMEQYAKEFVQGIQGSIGKITTYGDDNKVSFSLKIEVLNQNDFNTAFSKGDYGMALCSFTAESHNAVTFLEAIIDGNYLGTVDAVEKALKKAQSSSAEELAAACKNCEKAIMEDYSVMPVFFEASYYAQAKGVSGVQFHPGSGRVSFVNATRED
ncbi:MAG: peptide ABC transporter substrate-binding protein [Eubacterium sp.]